ncbi:ran-binding protein 3-like [Styela clava]
MADSSNVDPSSGIPNSGSTPGENGGGFCSGKESNRVMKRQRDEEDDVRDSPDDSEPEEKRGSFRLNPPTLIHGQAKPAPKEEGAQEASQKRNFLRPSILSAPAAPSQSVSAQSSAASEPVNGKSIPSISQVPILGTGLLLPGQVPSNNPFLRTNEEEQEKESKENFLFQSTLEQRNKENGASADVTGSDPYSKANGAKENTFLQMSNQEPASSTTSDDKTKSTGFVFGSKMEERVVKNEADSTSGTTTTQLIHTKTTEGSDFLFGKNLSGRAKVTSADSTNSTLATTHVESVIFHDSTHPTVDGVSSSSRKLEEDAAALFAASNTKPVMPEVEIKTGEEDEKNVLQILCKLFQYDSSNSKTWVERGRGHLRLNDKRVSSVDHTFESRLVMRTHGSLRLILNTKIWPTMVVDRASQKSVRISAQNEDGDIGMYLLQATINDAEQIYRAVEYRVLHLKQLQEREEAIKKATQSASDKGEQEVSSTESDQTKIKGFKESSDLPEPPVSSSDALPESDNITTESSKSDESGEIASSADTGCGAGDNTTTATEQERTINTDESTCTDNPSKHESESTAQVDPTEQKADTRD